MIRWVDLLALILKAHGETLQALAQFFGETELAELLEHAAPEQEERTNLDSTFRPKFQIDTSLFINPSSQNAQSFSPYEALEQTVREVSLPAVLDFYVWTYPFYRQLIELPYDLRSQIQIKSHPNFIESFCDQALAQANHWIHTLQIPAAHRNQAEQIAKTPWLRLRTDIYKRLGMRTLMQISP